MGFSKKAINKFQWEIIIYIIAYTTIKYGLPWWLSAKESTCQCRRLKFHPWVRKIPWRRKWQPTPVFLLGKSHGQRSLAAYSMGLQRVGHKLATKQQHKYQCFKNSHYDHLSGYSCDTAEHLIYLCSFHTSEALPNTICGCKDGRHTSS